MLGNLLDLPGFDYDSVDAVRKDCVGPSGIATRLGNDLQGPLATTKASTEPGASLERIGEIPIYHTDGIVRRAASLQLTRDAQVAMACIPGALADRIGLREGDRVRIVQNGGEAVLPFRRDDSLPANCARIPAGCHETEALGALFGGIDLERVASQSAAGVEQAPA